MCHDVVMMNSYLDHCPMRFDTVTDANSNNANSNIFGFLLRLQMELIINYPPFLAVALLVMLLNMKTKL